MKILMEKSYDENLQQIYNAAIDKQKEELNEKIRLKNDDSTVFLDIVMLIFLGCLTLSMTPLRGIWFAFGLAVFVVVVFCFYICLKVIFFKQRKKKRQLYLDYIFSLGSAHKYFEYLFNKEQERFLEGNGYCEPNDKIAELKSELQPYEAKALRDKGVLDNIMYLCDNPGCFLCFEDSEEAFLVKYSDRNNNVCSFELDDDSVIFEETVKGEDELIYKDMNSISVVKVFQNT
jgi:hypothetical protein